MAATVTLPITLRRLPPFELGWALLHIRRQAFLRILALEQQLLVLTLYGQRRLHRNLPARLHRSLDASYSLRRLIGWAELLGILQDVLHEAVALEDVVYDAEFLRLLKRKRVAGHHQFNGFALPDHAREPLRAAGSREHAEVHFRQANLAGILARDTDVGGHGDLQTAAHAMAIDSRDHQLRRVFEP